MLSEVQGYYEDARRAVQARLPLLLQRMAFYRGSQWGASSQFGWIPDSVELEEAREVYNYVRPTVRSAVASMLRAVPSPEAIAAHGGCRSVARALASHNLMRSFMRNGVIPFAELYRGCTDAQVKGACWFKTYWNPNAGKFIDVPRMVPSELDPTQMEPATDDFGQPQMDQHREGEITVEFCDVVDVLPDPHAKKESEIRHIFHRKLVPISTLMDQFPKDAFGESTESRWETQSRDHGQNARTTIEDDSRGGLIGFAGGYNSRNEGNELAELVEYWERPTNEFSKGRLIVFSGELIVAIGPLPYEFPWNLMLGENIVPNGLYSDGIVEDILPLQKTINLNASKRREWMDKILSPPLLNPTNSGIDEALFSDMAGSIISHNPGAKPEWMDVPGIPQSMFTIEEQLVAMIKDVSTYSDITRGEAPQGIETGRALAWLHEFQAGVHEPDHALVQETLARIMIKCLRLARDFYSEERTVKMLGDNDRMIARRFRKADYDFDAELIVNPFSGDSTSRAVRRAEVLEDFQAELYNDEKPGSKTARRLLGTDVADKNDVDIEGVHKSKARDEHLSLEENPFAPLQVREFHDHDIHIDEHNVFRNSADYDRLPPIAQQQFDMHVAEHELMRADALDGFAAEQGMLEGGSAPGAPPPAEPGIESPMDGGHSQYPESVPLPEPPQQGAPGDPAPTPQAT
jgi:hypothetical protein